MKIRKEIRINRVHCLQLWHYLLFKISSLKKLTSIFTSFFPTFSKLLSSHSYNIFAIYFSSNFPLLKFHSFTKSNFSYLLTSALSLLSNSATAFFAFSKSFSLSNILHSAVNHFHHTKYFTALLIFLLLNIFSTSYSLTLFTSTSFTFFILCLSTYSLYLTT